MGEYAFKTQVCPGNIWKLVLIVHTHAQQQVMLSSCICYHRQALMEVNVLADLLKITQEHKQYIMLDPVLQNPNVIKPSYQLYSKKKVASPETFGSNIK